MHPRRAAKNQWLISTAILCKDRLQQIMTSPVSWGNADSSHPGDGLDRLKYGLKCEWILCSWLVHGTCHRRSLLWDRQYGEPSKRPVRCYYWVEWCRWSKSWTTLEWWLRQWNRDLRTSNPKILFIWMYGQFLEVGVSGGSHFGASGSGPIESRIWSIERRHFQWLWTTPNPVFKVTL